MQRSTFSGGGGETHILGTKVSLNGRDAAVPSVRLPSHNAMRFEMLRFDVVPRGIKAIDQSQQRRVNIDNLSQRNAVPFLERSGASCDSSFVISKYLLSRKKTISVGEIPALTARLIYSSVFPALTQERS